MQTSEESSKRNLLLVDRDNGREFTISPDSTVYVVLPEMVGLIHEFWAYRPPPMPNPLIVEDHEAEPGIRHSGYEGGPSNTLCIFRPGRSPDGGSEEQVLEFEYRRDGLADQDKMLHYRIHVTDKRPQTADSFAGSNTMRLSRSREHPRHEVLPPFGGR